MKSAIVFEANFDVDTVALLIEQINALEPDINIYVNTDGGDSNSLIPVIDFINECHKERKITLIGYGSISSSGFDLFRLTQCPKKILPGTYAILHKTKLELDESNIQHTIQKKLASASDEEFYKFLKASRVISANDLKNFNLHKDIMVDYDKLCKLLNIHRCTIHEL